MKRNVLLGPTYTVGPVEDVMTPGLNLTVEQGLYHSLWYLRIGDLKGRVYGSRNELMRSLGRYIRRFGAQHLKSDELDLGTHLSDVKEWL